MHAMEKPINQIMRVNMGQKSVVSYHELKVVIYRGSTIAYIHSMVAAQRHTLHPFLTLVWVCGPMW